LFESLSNQWGIEPTPDDRPRKAYPGRRAKKCLTIGFEKLYEKQQEVLAGKDPWNGKPGQKANQELT
jgi:hypothetical protein